ncbi:hypothetical protein [Cytobacillus firmus]|uniref:hypothetical protein n=1 Tax=Cytobacillus firmus TaxID=1399 RepID=UPI0018CEA8B9|nr:hypothetical protein [Cytobacillus firmus]MBG9446277.1 hypothetical protein [Cytobacillus firmus]
MANLLDVLKVVGGFLVLVFILWCTQGYAGIWVDLPDDYGTKMLDWVVFSLLFRHIDNITKGPWQ